MNTNFQCKIVNILLPIIFSKFWVLIETVLWSTKNIFFCYTLLTKVLVKELYNPRISTNYETCAICTGFIFCVFPVLTATKFILLLLMLYIAVNNFSVIWGRFPGLICMFDLILYVPVNNFSVMS